MKFCLNHPERSVYAKGLCNPCYWEANKSKNREAAKQKKGDVLTKVTIGGEKLSKSRLETLKLDKQLYTSVWSKRPHYCENCDKWLGDKMLAVFMSHILSKGSYPEHRHKEENINLLCFECHQVWEFGDRSSMRIFAANQKVIAKLKSSK